ncbi:MAG: ATP-dependent DNA helicase RecG [Ignavibacteria bacterium]|nr:ATP-dependent DNA helicase RecG [Ignavibacteria bacterium]
MELKFLKGVGEKRAEAFKKIGISAVEDFLRFVPRIYIKKISIKDFQNKLNENVIIKGKVFDIIPPVKQTHPVNVIVADETGYMDIPMFGKSEFRSKQFIRNQDYLFWGKTDYNHFTNMYSIGYRDHLRLNLKDENDYKFSNLNIFPVYELAGILKKTWIKPLLLTRITYNAFAFLLKNKSEFVFENIPDYILEQENLSDKKKSIIKINFPKEASEIETARKRLAFEELFYLELILALKKRSVKIETKGISFSVDIKKLTDNFVKALAFELTNAQKKVINDIYKDMISSNVMNRLLQGDVGSGKTIVSIFAMLIALESGYQTALMCPTEILAEQHYYTVSRFIEKYNKASGTDWKVAILVGGQKKKLREELYNSIRNRKTHIIVGTHALIQQKVEYNNLGLVIIDEQHKFGVLQRAALKEKGLNPDVLVMTATPIPRTLSLTVYGDLDVSVIDELPGGRKPVKTYLRYENDRRNVYEFVRNEVKKGKQVFVIYPIIDESEKLDIKSAEKNYRIIKEKIFPDIPVGMVHGRLLWYEKEEEMKKFVEGKIKILVSTTVIEVGIDIPNATLMIIEDAQRFGLSQLHQLRGRVGRGALQSHCALIAKNLDETSEKRLKILCETTDGFRIAEEDLEIRGPGEFFGTRQSGIINFSVTDLQRDKNLLIKARDIAFGIVKKDPQLRLPEHLNIRKYFLENFKDAYYLMKIA